MKTQRERGGRERGEEKKVEKGWTNSRKKRSPKEKKKKRDEKENNLIDGQRKRQGLSCEKIERLIDEIKEKKVKWS